MDEFNVSHPKSAAAVRQKAEHTLFVEGSTGDVDEAAMKALFDDTAIEIEELGNCGNVMYVAEALHRHHPNYYFIIDRDGQDDEFVEGLWRGFPDPEQKNLLIWRRKEIENYFVDPDFFAKFKEFAEGDIDFQLCSVDEYVDRLQTAARSRVYFDAANRVIRRIRFEFQQTRLELFQGTTGFDSAENARQRLLDEIAGYQNRVTDLRATLLFEDEIRFRYDKEIELLLGESDSCQLGKGQWLALMNGKKLFHQMANDAFRVFSRQRVELQGGLKRREIIQAMCSLPEQELPEDFQLLKQMVRQRMQE